MFFAPLSSAHGTLDLVRSQVGVRTGLETYLPTQAGALHQLFGASNYASFPEVPAEITPTTPFTIAWTHEPRTPSAFGTVITVKFSTVPSDYSFVVYTGVSADVYRFSAGPRGGGSATGHSWDTTVGALTDQQLDRFVLSSAGGPNSSTAGDWQLWRNGVLLSRTASATFTAFTTEQFFVGARETGADPFEGLIGDLRMWSRVLTAGESEEESTVQGGWALYAPRRVFIPVAAAPSSTPVLSAATVFNITSTTARPRVTITF